MGCGASPGEKKATGEAEGTPGNQQQEQLPGEEKGGQGAASGAPSVDKDPAKPQAGVDRKGNTEQESKDDQDGGYNDKEKKNSEGAAKPKASDQKVGTDKPSGTPPKPSIDDMSKPPEWLTKSNTKKHLSFHAEYKGHYRIPSDPNISMTEYLQIKTEDEYKSFVSTIPLNKIQMKQPAPPSDDALLAFPPIDFQNRMLLVVLRFDSMYKAPVITSVCQTRARTRRYQSGWTPWTTSVTYQHPDIGDTAACSAPEGIGSYHAVVVDRLNTQFNDSRTSPISTGEVQWHNQSKSSNAVSRGGEEAKASGPPAFQQAPQAFQQAQQEFQQAPNHAEIMMEPPALQQAPNPDEMVINEPQMQQAQPGERLFK